MKSKYMSRKFILAVLWLIVAVIGLGLGNDKLVLIAQLPTIFFIIGESIIDKASSVKQSLEVHKNEYKDVAKPIRED